jgi:hypothetical protein
MSAFTVRRPGMLMLLGAALLLAVPPARTLVAAVQSGRAVRLLDDQRTAHRDAVPISEETIPRYAASIGLLAKAAAWEPSNAEHPRALADLEAKLSGWGETMNALGQPLPDGILDAGSLRERSDRAYLDAIALEPTSPYHHLARARSLANRDAAAQAEELERAAQLAPFHSPLRYEVAVQYLLARDPAGALKHARALAASDDSYRMSESIAKQKMIEMHTAVYEQLLHRSYLYLALELVWRSTGGNVDAVRSAVPGNGDAQRVRDEFLLHKGIAQ